jgi:toxin ParE1/3/4
MPQVRRTALAINDLREIAYFIGEQTQSRETVLRWLDLIDRRCDVYATQPLLGEAFPEAGIGLRKFSVGNYLVIYRPIPAGIEIIRVVNGRRDLRELWPPGQRDR